MGDGDTIFALSSARGRAGVCVIRVSGSRARVAVAAMTGNSAPEPRQATLRRFVDARGEPIDRGLVLWFPSPHSFTGEDIAEFHAHGSPAVVAALVARLGQLNGLRPAEPGEFTRRAFANGKFDLTEAEGLADLIAAETEQQRRQALRQMDGALLERYERWREMLVKTLAHLEAVIDFSEEDLPSDLFERVSESALELKSEIDAHLSDRRRGEIVRDGFSIVILGAPNVGKSSLLNALAARDVAIVTATAGTTRDLIEVDLDLGGYSVTVVDTAGLRETSDEIESEGIARARARAERADMRIAVVDATSPLIDDLVARSMVGGDLVVANKIDLTVSHESAVPDSSALEVAQPDEIGAEADAPDADSADAASESRDEEAETIPADVSQLLDASTYRVSNELTLPIIPISARDGTGISRLLSYLTEQVIARTGGGEAAPLTRARHRNALEAARDALARAAANLNETRAMDLAAEDLRLAAREIGRITGRVDVEDLLEVIFREFCIGK
ncbi:MAG: tRNA uridine-5-carboxymethylaminomethyl(34) synthesis GTPase MnmE [Alphaproteobacteria bacterium]|nr:tRNA uridine-5-carboxymethylaminomethyl(34) synthesis GTPase MnmE [Alphaproteobacteria bacterium]